MIVADLTHTLTSYRVEAEAELQKIAQKRFDGDRIAFGRDPNTLLSFTDHELLFRGEELGFLNELRAAKLAPDDVNVAVGLDDGSIVLVHRDYLVERTLFLTSSESPKFCWLDNGYIAAVDGPHILIRQIDTPLSNSTRIQYAHDRKLVTDVCRLSNGTLASSGTDGTVRTWDSNGNTLLVFETKSGEPIHHLAAGRDKAADWIAGFDVGGAIHIFNSATKALVASIQSDATRVNSTTIAGFSPDGRYFAFSEDEGDRLWIWQTSDISLGDSAPRARYRNAKVVLVGDTGVGKSGLALRLRSQDFAPTESTHARQVWSVKRETLPFEDTEETREILLWDLAGQPGYRLFHRLSLRDVAVGLVVFDSRDELDPFRGVSYWARALDEAAGAEPPVKFLVAARIDRGGVRVSKERIDRALLSGGFRAFVETSAKTRAGLQELWEHVESGVPWEQLPVIIAPEVFSRIRQYLLDRKQGEGLIAGGAELLKDFEEESQQKVEARTFVTCLQRLEAAGLIAKISVGDRWLLKPELLDSYVAWLSQAARREPDGLGAISETAAIAGDYEHDALPRSAEESLMLLTTVEEVVARGLALRVATDEGQMLVFPSELRRDLPDQPTDLNFEMRFEFTGPVSAVYATVVVRLVNSATYGGQYRLYKDAAIFDAAAPLQGFVGIVAELVEGDDARGKLTVFSDGEVTAERRLAFLQYVDLQLTQIAVKDTVVRSRLFYCCGMEVPPAAVQIRKTKGLTTVICPACGQQMPMGDLTDSWALPTRAAMDLQHRAVQEQARQQRLAMLPARVKDADYQSFICYNSVDRPVVGRLWRILRDEGVVAWFDDQEVLAGNQPIARMEDVIDTVPSALIIFGPNSIGPWQEQEYFVFLDRAVRHRQDGLPFKLIPVLMPGAPDREDLPPFARTYSPVDLRRGGFGPANISRLIKAIFD